MLGIKHVVAVGGVPGPVDRRVFPPNAIEPSPIGAGVRSMRQRAGDHHNDMPVQVGCRLVGPLETADDDFPFSAAASTPSANGTQPFPPLIVSTMSFANPLSGTPILAPTARAKPLQSRLLASKQASYMSLTLSGSG